MDVEVFDDQESILKHKKERKLLSEKLETDPEFREEYIRKQTPSASELEEAERIIAELRNCDSLTLREEEEELPDIFSSEEKPSEEESSLPQGSKEEELSGKKGIVIHFHAQKLVVHIHN